MARKKYTNWRDEFKDYKVCWLCKSCWGPDPLCRYCVATMSKATDMRAVPKKPAVMALVNRAWELEREVERLNENKS